MKKPSLEQYKSSSRTVEEIRKDLDKANSGGAIGGIILFILCGFFLFPIVFAGFNIMFLTDYFL